LVDWGRLDDAVGREVLVRGRSNGKTGRWALSAGGHWGLDGPSKCTNLGIVVVVVGAAAGVIRLGWAALAALLACLDNLALALSYIQTALELLAHGWVLGVEAGRETGKANIVQLAGRAGGEGAARVDNVVVGQVQALGSVAGGGGGGHVGRAGFLLDDNLGSRATRPARGGTVRHEGHDVSVRRGH